MKKYFSGGLTLLLLFGSCKQETKGSKIMGEWQAVSLENAQMETVLAQQKNVIDTMTQFPDNPGYGIPEDIKTLDSFKARAYRELEGMRLSMTQEILGTHFTFRKDSVAVLQYPQGADSARFSVEGDTALVLNERALKTVGEERLVMRVAKLSADSLVLALPGNGQSGKLHFKRAEGGKR